MGNLAIFDVDGTLINGQSQRILTQFMFKYKRLSFFAYVKIITFFVLYKFDLIKDVSNARKKFLKMFAGINVVEIEGLFRKCFEEKIKPKIYQQAKELLNKHKEKGDEILLVSASLYHLLKYLQEYLGADYLFSTKLEVEGGVYTGRIDGEAVFGRKKIAIIQEFLRRKDLPYENIYAYTDNISDLPLLEFVSNPIVVNPGRKLRKIARKKNWQVYKLKY